jgi:hypothetical protein
MTATLNFLSRITNEVFESQMRRAARKIRGSIISAAAPLSGTLILRSRQNTENF